jgi:hypothetical protein
MVIPGVSFAVGCFILIWGAAIFFSPMTDSVPSHLWQRDRFVWFLSYFLVALALMLGMAGYLNLAPSTLLHPIRIGLGAAGIALFLYQLVRVVSRPHSL